MFDDLRSQICCLIAAPLLCSGLVGGATSMTGSSFLASASAGPQAAQARGEEPSVLARGYEMVGSADLQYSVAVVEKLLKHFLEKAETFSPDELEVIEKEFWNLG